jgi:hypothetical protein
MLDLLDMTDAAYQKAAAETARYIVNYDPNRPTTAFLRDLIADAIDA